MLGPGHPWYSCNEVPHSLQGLPGHHHSQPCLEASLPFPVSRDILHMLVSDLLWSWVCVCVSGCLPITQGQQLRLLGLLFSGLTHFPRYKRSSVKCLSDTPGFPQCIVGSCSLTCGLLSIRGHPWRTRNHLSSLECVRSWKHFSLLCLCPLTLQLPQEVSLFFLELRYSFGRALPIQSLSY